MAQNQLSLLTIPYELRLYILDFAQSTNLFFVSKSYNTLWKQWIKFPKKHDIPKLLEKQDIRSFLPRINRFLKYEHTFPNCAWLEPFLTPKRKRITFDTIAKKIHLSQLLGRMDYPKESCEKDYMIAFADGAGKTGKDMDFSDCTKRVREQYVISKYVSTKDVNVVLKNVFDAKYCFVYMGNEGNFKDFFTVSDYIEQKFTDESENEEMWECEAKAFIAASAMLFWTGTPTEELSDKTIKKFSKKFQYMHFEIQH